MSYDFNNLDHPQLCGCLETSVLMAKPQSTEVELTVIADTLAEFASEQDLDVVATRTMNLEEDEVRELYTGVFSDIGKESDYITELRGRILDYMTSGQVIALLLVGHEALAKTAKIKQFVRESRPDTFEERKLRNLVHSPDDSDDLERNLRLLFGAITVGHEDR